ncbi:MAG: hypothetical protein JWN40_178 [Phycisphaerales bacterium]|nr:hypothetical protein [Phycisphaerales bacterium]
MRNVLLATFALTILIGCKANNASKPVVSSPVTTTTPVSLNAQPIMLPAELRDDEIYPLWLEHTGEIKHSPY